VIRSFDDARISTKLILAFGGVLLSICAVIAAVVLKLSDAEAARVSTGRIAEVIQLNSEAESAMQGQSSAIRGLLLTMEPAHGERYRQEKVKFEKSSAKMREMIKSQEARALLDQTVGAASEWQKQVGDVQASVATNRAALEGAMEIVRSGLSGRLYEAYSTANDRLEALERKQIEGLRIEESAAEGGVKVALFVGGLVALLLSVGFGFLLSRGIGRPVSAMTGAMGRLAAGDNAVEIPGADRRDEIGEMAKAVEVFKRGAIERVRIEREAEEQRGLTEEERARNEKARAVSAREQAHVVSNIGSGLDALAKGDLTFRISEAFPGEYRKLQDDFNAAMETLQETMKTIAGATEGIRSGTGEVSQAADDLSKRTEQQAASLEETAAALDQITATVRKTAEGANHARDAVTTAKADAERSGEVVNGAVLAMAEIDRSSKEISKIIGVIDEIAFQTNLLALNAGVEAARAGEAGKGFAVVASEVRALAQRSAEAAKEIKTLIQASSTQVESGVDLVGQAGKALERIVVQVAEINAVVVEIAASAKEQATGLAEVNTAVNQMDQVTQQNAAMVEQSTAASHSLAQEAEELGRLVARFEVGRGTKMTPLPKRSGLEQTGRQRVVTALKTVGGRAISSIRKPAAEAAAESWEEF
jgi:methyl-accepting chemotaxis protein